MTEAFNKDEKTPDPAKEQFPGLGGAPLKPGVIFLRILGIVAFAEFVVMILLHYIDIAEGVLKYFMDSLLLSILSAPFLYFWIVRAVARRLKAEASMAEAVLKAGAEEELLESEEKFRKISASAQDAIIMMDSDGDISYWNPASERIFGYSNEEAIRKDLHALIVPPNQKNAFKEGFDRFKETGEGPVIDKTVELSALRKNGTEFPVEVSISAVLIKGQWHSIGIIRDITERKRYEETIVRMAYHDHLTGLPNRLLLNDRLEQALAMGRRHRSIVAVLFLDIDLDGRRQRLLHVHPHRQHPVPEHGGKVRLKKAEWFESSHKPSYAWPSRGSLTCTATRSVPTRIASHVQPSATAAGHLAGGQEACGFRAATSSQMRSRVSSLA